MKAIARAALAASLLALAACSATTAPDTTPVGAIEVPPVQPRSGVDERIAHYAALYDVPESLIRRSIKRESNYNPNARNGPYWGLMQIRYDTARGLGYRGSPHGLLDADTNLKYAARYLANAYIVAGRNEDRAMRLYAGGYYWEARRRGLLDRIQTAGETQTASATP